MFIFHLHPWLLSLVVQFHPAKTLFSNLICGKLIAVVDKKFISFLYSAAAAASSAVAVENGFQCVEMK
jgi:hypothetical protein